MAQTTGATTLRNVVIEWSTNSSDWVDVSGEANSVEPSGGAVISGEVYTGASDAPIIGVGKDEPIEVDINVVYTESTAEGFVELYTLKTNRTPMRLRYAPKGTATGNYRWTTHTGYVVECLPPGGEIEDGTPLLAAAKIKAPGIGYAAIS